MFLRLDLKSIHIYAGMLHGVWHRAWLTHFRLKGIEARILYEWPWYSRGLIPSFCLPLLLISLKWALIENHLLARRALTKSHRCRGSDRIHASPLGPETEKLKNVPARGDVYWGLCSGVRTAVVSCVLTRTFLAVCMGADKWPESWLCDASS